MVVESRGAAVALPAVLRPHQHVRVTDLAVVLVVARVKCDVRFFTSCFQLQSWVRRVYFCANIPVIAGTDCQEKVDRAQNY